MTSRHISISGHITRALLCGLLVYLQSGAALADARQLSLMPDPRGEFIRLCAPFMARRYAHPETVCDCLRNAMFDQIGDSEIRDATLYGVTERGVPTLNRAWLSSEKWSLIEGTMTAIAEPTMQCMFGSGATPRTRLDPSPDRPTPMPPVQDFTP